MNLPFGGINITAGATTQALSTAAALMNTWNTATGSNLTSTGSVDGDPAVRPDKANNRITVNSPGRYLVMVNISGTNDGTQNITAQVRKNGTVYPGLKANFSWLQTLEFNVSFFGILEVTRADCPGTIATMPAASTTGFSGASGAPQTEVAIDIVLTSGASTPTITVKEANFLMFRL